MRARRLGSQKQQKQLVTLTSRMRMIATHITFVLTLLALTATTAQASHRLEPADGHALHLGGQSDDAFTNYSRFLGKGSWPAGYMSYIGVDTLNETVPGELPEQLVALATDLTSREPSRFLVPQIGLSFTSDDRGYGAAIAAGEYDNGIEALTRSIAKLFADRPVLIRVGYEFNGRSWNGYEPASYVAAFQHISKQLRANLPGATSEGVALVWDYSCDDADNPWEPYWPGDDVVDWWGVNIFSGSSGPSSSCAKQFIAAAAAKGYPVLLGESTPRGIGANSSWSEWFGPYFDLVADRAVKGFCYIDWAWQDTSRWPKWGDARIERFPLMSGDRFRATVADGSTGIFNGASKAATRAFLGLPATSTLLATD